jgi:predicted nucleic acid-binding protein
MYLVDTSVLIDVLNNVNNGKAELFRRIESHHAPYGITPYTYFELLQGVREDRAFLRLKDYLDSIPRYRLPSDDSAYEQAANLYRRCRKAGITPRSSIDILIAQTAIHFDLELLHNDVDFDLMQTVIKELRLAK